MSDPSLYGAQHQAERARYQARMDRGETFLCARCGKPVDPTHWDLGHKMRTTYNGPEHPPCNRATNTHRAAQRLRPKPPHPGMIGDRA